MIIRYIFPLLMMWISAITLSAQTKDLSIDQISDHVSRCLEKNYKPDSVLMGKLCRKACVFIKFKVNTNGKIVDLAFSKDSIPFIKKALTIAMDSLQHDVQLMKMLSRSGKTIIQPFIYDYELGCKLNEPNELSTILKAQKDGKSGKPEKSYFEIKADMEHLDSTLTNMMVFSDGKLTGIDCILLAPYSDLLSAPMY